MPELSRRVQTFTDSVIRRMTRINDMTPGSINLSQGFPDFDPPKEILEALKVAAEHGPHQYSITFGAKISAMLWQTCIQRNGIVRSIWIRRSL